MFVLDLLSHPLFEGDGTPSVHPRPPTSRAMRPYGADFSFLPAVTDSAAVQVDLKDKWRNLLRLAVTAPTGLRGKADKRRELPAELVQKVKLCTTGQP